MSIKDSTIDQTLLLKIRAVFPDYALAVLTEINLRGPKSVTKLTMVFRWQYCHGLPIKQTPLSCLVNQFNIPWPIIIKNTNLIRK